MTIVPSSHAAVDGAHEGDPSVDVLLTRAEQTLMATGERLLVERLHRYLDERGVTALAVLSDTLLPHLQTLVTLLPHIVHDDADANVTETVERLGVLLQEQGVSLQDLVTEWVGVHDHLLQGFASHLRESDRALVTAVIQISRNVLEAGQRALLAYQQSETSSLRQAALSDSLTGLANRRYFDERFQEELLRAHRLERTLALILVDVDGLKGVNDTFGHAAGDRLLSVFASVLRANTRGIDLAARIGGDEFALLLPETDRPGALALMQRLIHGVEEHIIHDRPIRFSAGIAFYPDDGRIAPELMLHADSNLYRNKAKRVANGP